MRTILLLLCLASISCETTQVVHHKAAALPPEVQKAQDQVWDLQAQLYQAMHDLAIAQINRKEDELLNRKNENPALYNGYYMQAHSQLEEQRMKVEYKYSISQQWYTAVQNGDVDTARDLQQQMNQ
jgi:hypothetical protein